jgi:hypothetical protein
MIIPARIAAAAVLIIAQFQPAATTDLIARGTANCVA